MWFFAIFRLRLTKGAKNHIYLPQQALRATEIHFRSARRALF